MDKTASNEKTQKKNKNSDKKAEEIKVTGQLAAALKREWEELAKRQEQRGIKVSSKNKIRSVSLTKNQHGKISVRVNMENGARLFDNAKEHNVDKFKARAESVYRRSKIEELLKKIKEYGYAAVEGEIPAELKEAVLKSMEKANISTSYKGEKAEAEAARQAAQNAAKFADNALNAAINFPSRPATPNMQAAYDGGRLKYPSLPTYLSQEALDFFAAHEYEKHKAIANILAEPMFKNAYVEHSRLGSPAVTLRREIPDANGMPRTVLDKGSLDRKRETSARNDALIYLLTKDPASLTEAEKNALNAIKEKIIKKDHLSKDCSDKEWKELALHRISSKGFEGELAPIMKQLQKEPTSPEMKALLANLDAQMKKDAEERKQKERLNKIEQIKCALSNETGLTKEGENLKKALLDAGITLEDMRKPDGNEKIEALLKRNGLFQQSDGTYAATCLQADKDRKDQSKKEAYDKALEALSGKSSEEITYQYLLDTSRNNKKIKLPPETAFKLNFTKMFVKQFIDKTKLPGNSIVIDEASSEFINKLWEENKGRDPYAVFKECFPDGLGQAQNLVKSDVNQKITLSKIIESTDAVQRLESFKKAVPSIEAKETVPRMSSAPKEQKVADKAQKEALLDPNNAVSAEKIRQAKAVLGKKAKGEPLTEKEQNLLVFTHKTFKNVSDLKPTDLDDPKYKKQLSELLKCKKHYSNLPKEKEVSSQQVANNQPKKEGKQQPVATSQPKQQTQSNETEAERVKNRIKENMLAYKASSEKIVAHAEQKTGKVGLQQKLQQDAKNPNTSSRQQAPSPAVQAALLKKKEGLVR